MLLPMEMSLKDVHVAEVGKFLILEDRIELDGKRSPKWRSRAGAIVIMGPQHVGRRHRIEEVATADGSDVRHASSGLGIGIGRGGGQSVSGLIPGNRLRRVDATRSGRVLQIARIEIRIAGTGNDRSVEKV